MLFRSPHSVKMLSEFVPDIPRGLTTSKFSAEKWPLISRQRADMLAEISDFDRSGSCFVSHDHRSLDTPPIKALKVSGVPIICWTVRSATQEAKARLVADNITFEGYIPASHPQAKEANRSEEHTSELQSRRNLVCRLLLEKKKNKTKI